MTRYTITNQQSPSLLGLLQGVEIRETFNCEQFKSLFELNACLVGNLEISPHEPRVIVSSKLILSLNEDICFKLNPHMGIIYKSSDSNNSVEMIQGFNNMYKTVEFSTDFRVLLKDLLPYLNGDYTVKAIAEKYLVSETEMLKILQPLYEIGFLVLVSKSLVPASSLYAHLMSLKRAQRLQMMKSLNINLSKQSSEKSLKDALVQNLFSLYHYSRFLPDHLSTAISQTTDHELREQLCGALFDCFWYSNMLLKGLTKLGYPIERVKRSIPSPAVLGIINYLRWLAKTDLHSYAAYSGQFER